MAASSEKNAKISKRQSNAPVIANPISTTSPFFTPYPGTTLYDKCLETNLLGDRLNMQLERCRPVLNPTVFSSNQIKREYLLFAYKVYKGKWSLITIAKKTVCTWIRASLLLNIAYK